MCQSRSSYHQQLAGQKLLRLNRGGRFVGQNAKDGRDFSDYEKRQSPEENDFAHKAVGRSSGFFGKFGYFLRRNKCWWLTPVFILVPLLGILVVQARPRSYARCSDSCLSLGGQTYLRMQGFLVRPVEEISYIVMLRRRITLPESDAVQTSDDRNADSPR
jgi:hypothetical protein